jgi:tripartite-type tricarboxylate transporter receptor subunit TctC
MRAIRRRLLTLTAGGIAVLASPIAIPIAKAQSYPEKPIHLLVPFPPGGLTDSIGRLVAERLKGLGQPVIVENRPGAGTLLAGSQVAGAPPDGYTLMVATSTTLGIAPFLFKDPAIQLKDLTGVAMIGDVTLLLVARPEFPAGNLRDLVRLLRDNPGKFNYATPGNGTVHHLVVEMLKQQEGLFAAHIPYRGSPQAMSDVISGSVDFMFLDAAVALPQIRSGRLKAVGVTGTSRSPLLPEVEAIGEVFPEISLSAWQGIAAPARTPKAVIEKLNAHINQAMATGDLRQQLLQIGVDAKPMTTGEFNELVARDAPRWERLVQASGARVD